VGRTSVEESIGQKINELPDRWDITGHFSAFLMQRMHACSLRWIF